MPRLRFTVKDIEFEYIGDQKDIIDFIRALWDTQFGVTSLKEIATKPSVVPTKSLTNLPSDYEVLQYIIQKPDFKHTLFDVQEHFFGKQFKSRGPTMNMYIRTSTQLKRVHKKIEKEYTGKFESKIGKGRRKYYSFKKEQYVL